jgi:hypothetical protein
MEEINNYDRAKFFPRMSVEASRRITEWEETQARPVITFEDLGLSPQITRKELEDYRTEMKLYITGGLSDEDNEILWKSTSAVSRHKKTKIDK